jgi:ribosomal protein S18 acetylase RimI-like enzyme
MQIEQVSVFSDELYEAFLKLIPQLTVTKLPPTREDLDVLIKSESSLLVIARQSETRGSIIGAACLVVYRVPTGVRAIVEDVIVDESVRSQGIGEALIKKLIEIAKEKGANGVALTSNPSRMSANRLYQRIGFSRRETNAYFYKF